MSIHPNRIKSSQFEAHLSHGGWGFKHKSSGHVFDAGEFRSQFDAEAAMISYENTMEENGEAIA